MKVKKQILMVLVVILTFLAMGCDLNSDKSSQDPEIRVQVENEDQTIYLSVGVIDDGLYFNSSEWIMASGGFSDYVSVDEGEYVVATDNDTDHAIVYIIRDAADQTYWDVEFLKNRRYTLRFGLDGYVHLEED